MANEFYITAGLPAIDSADSPATNAFYITAGLVANDYTPAASGWRKIRDMNASIDIFGDKVGGVF